MYRSIAAMLFVALLAVSNTAHAQDKSGWEIHGGIGPTVIRDEDGSETFRGSSFGFVFGGGYRFNDHFALSLNIMSLGEGDDTIASVPTTIDVRAIGLSGRIILPVSEKVEIFGLIGNISYNADVDPGCCSNPFGSEAWEFGGGVDFATSENFSIRIAGRYYQGRRDETGGIATAGFSWRF